MKQKKTKAGRSPTTGKPRRSVEIRWDPKSEKLLRERLKSPEGQRAMGQLIRILAKAAVDRMTREAAESQAPKTVE